MDPVGQRVVGRAILPAAASQATSFRARNVLSESASQNWLPH